jgi:hypothetical protein
VGAALRREELIVVASVEKHCGVDSCREALVPGKVEFTFELFTLQTLKFKAISAVLQALSSSQSGHPILARPHPAQHHQLILQCWGLRAVGHIS